ncbi:hypothetical protein TRFO_03426 [Tritrichomonas foetus]|uniref:Uncharacterized protein n=1 Tax=Tritrichomonas foetus TaxID=1144522 RepID=A0A1J4KTA4_9EUKA|nr:hypothetical protein TRFO_03426 [Tritrichomonas foetus]|eukprot:OHT13020.1 hypothetical protein TRFO_03426 [Tritrichomonas foetus]
MNLVEYDDSLARISFLERKISERQKAINDMEKTIAEYLGKIEEKKIILRETNEKRNKLFSKLYAYRKAIRLSSKSPKSLVDYTKELFDKQNMKIFNIENEIERSNEIIQKLQVYAAESKKIIRELHIPEFGSDLLVYDFNQSLTIDKDLIKKLNGIEFSKDELIEKQKLKFQLQKEIPEKPKIVEDFRPKMSTIKRKPSREMKDAISFDSHYLNKTTSFANKILRKHQNYSIPQINISSEKAYESSNTIKKLNNSMKRIDLEKVQKVKLFEGAYKPQINKLRKKYAISKRNIKKNQKELAELKLDLPEQYCSREGLLKWRDQLLRRRDYLRNELSAQIKREKMQLQDRKTITKARVSHLMHILNDNSYIK